MYRVVWSGGLDSTVLLHHHLQKRHDVVAVVLDHNLFSSRHSDMIARARLVLWFREKGFNVTVDTVRIDIDTRGGYGGSIGQLGQILSAVVPTMRNDEALEVGVCAGDSVLEDWVTWCETGRRLGQLLGLVGVEFDWPLRRTDKSWLVEYASTHGFLKHCSWCQLGKKPAERCSCASCVRMWMARHMCKSGRRLGERPAWLFGSPGWADVIVKDTMHDHVVWSTEADVLEVRDEFGA